MKARLVKKEKRAKDIYSYFFEVESLPKYTAGQFIEMTIKHPHPDDRGIRHWFTLSSPPGSQFLTITTRYLGDGASSFKKALNSLKPTDYIDISDPMGDFVLTIDRSRPVLFVAGGIGITPYLSILGYLSKVPEKRSLSLLYSVKQRSEAIDIANYSRLLKSFNLQVTGQKGHLVAEDILKMATQLDNPLIYISGPEKMVEALSQDLTDYGIDSDDIIGDFFPGYD